MPRISNKTVGLELANLLQSKDSVTTAFNIILEEIESVRYEINSQGADFQLKNDYPKAKASMKVGEDLQKFYRKLTSLKQEWMSGLDEPTRRKVKVEANVVTKMIASSNNPADNAGSPRDIIGEIGEKHHSTKAASPNAREWLAKVPELRNKSHLKTWQSICDYLQIPVDGDSARRRIKKWAKENNKRWPDVPNP